jgi:hypothetical protein
MFQLLITTPALAFGQACATATTGDKLLAMTSADAMRNARWGTVGTGWGSSFQFKMPPRNPFALKSEQPDASELPPIAGLIAAKSITCLIYEVHPPRAFVVRYSADGLRFNENAAGWTPPMRPITIMLLSVEMRNGTWVATDVPDGRTAIPPFSVLRRPTEAEVPVISQALAVTTPVAKKRR